MKKNRKHIFLCVCIAICSIFAHVSCKKPNQDTGNLQEEKELVLTSLKIHGEEVDITKPKLSVDVSLKHTSITIKNIDAKFNIEGAKVLLKEAEIPLKEGEAVPIELEVKASKGKWKAWNKTVFVRQLKDEITQPKKLIDTLYINAGKINNEQTSKASAEDVDRILNGEDVTVEIVGPYAEVVLGSRTQTWSLLKINGSDTPHVLQGDYASVALKRIELDEIGKVVDVKIELGAKRKFASASFKIKRVEGKVDIPDLSLQINKDEFSPVDKEFWALLYSTSKTATLKSPDPAMIKVRCRQNLIKSIKINHTPVATIENDEKGWFGKGSISGISASGTDVLIEIEPLDAENYRTLTWHFKLNYVSNPNMPIEYMINGKELFEYPDNFAQNFHEGKNPLLTLDSAFVNISMFCNSNEARPESVKVNTTDYTGKVQYPPATEGSGWRLHVPLKIEGEMQVEIVIEPKDKAKFGTTEVRFKVKGHTNKEKIKVEEFSINGNKDLPKSTFLDLLEGSSNPLYEVAGDKPVKLSFAFKEYWGDFHVKNLNIAGDDVSVVRNGIKLLYTAEKDIAINTTTPVDVVVQFVPKNAEMTEGFTWKFQLKGGGALPPVPKDRIAKFYINELGKPEHPFDPSFKDGLTDTATPPLLTLDGHNAHIYVAVYEDNKTHANEVLKEVGFVYDGNAEVKKTLQKNVAEYTFEATHDVTFPEDGSEHLIKVVMYPKDESKYSTLTYNFKVKSSGSKAEMPLEFTYNGREYTDDFKANLNFERVTLAVQAKDDIVNSITLNNETLTIKELTLNGKKIWRVEKTVLLPKDAQKDFEFKVVPKDANTYKESRRKCSLKGSQTSSKNAEFEYIFEPVETELTFFDSQVHEAKDYGAKKLILKAHTVSRESKVYYKIGSSLFDNNFSGGTLMNKDATDEYKHISDEITLKENLPTRILVWVVSKNNKTDKTNGRKKFIFNDVRLKWDKQAKLKGDDFENTGYAEIEVKKSELEGNMLYLAFAMLKEEAGYKILESFTPPAHQGVFEKLEETGDMQWYKTAINVSSLSTGNDLEVVLPITKNGSPCFEYKVKIKEGQ